MAQIKKLMIQGIRSFDPDGDSAQIIEFYSPMTLIVGQNGCGKTTIIEALKFSITGEPPPITSRAGSFVNDPKLGNGFEVKALVKLEVQDRVGDKIVVSRRLKAAVKGKLGNVSQTNTEVTIQKTTAADKKKTTMNSKCIDIKDEMCRVMGVSEPILNNVIFCHQEDACWPLDEASKVKTKFDDIFNTTKYIKALKALNNAEKDIGHMLKVSANDLHYRSQNLTQAKKMEADLEDAKNRLKALTDLIQVADREVAELEEKKEVHAKLEREYVMIVSEVTTKRTQIDGLKRNNMDTRKNITEVFEGDLTELKEAIASFEFVHNDKKSVLESTERELKIGKKELDSLGKLQQEYIRKEGTFTAREDENNRKVTEMRSILMKLAACIKTMKENSQDDEVFPIGLDTLLSSYETDVDSVGAGTAVTALTSAIQVKGKELEALRTEYDAKEKKLQDAIDKLRKEDTALATELKLKEKNERENTKKIEEYSRQLRELEGSSEKLQELDIEEVKWTSVVDNIEKTGVVQRFENEIKSLKAELAELEAQKKVLSEQQALLSKDNGLVDQINLQNTARLRKRTECSEIMRRIEPQLNEILGNVPQENLRSALQSKLDTLKKESLKKSAEIKKLEQEITRNETQCNQMNKDLLAKEQEVKAWKKKVNKVVETGDFTTEYEEVVEEAENLQKTIFYSEAAGFLAKKNIKSINRRPCCPLCHRDFNTDAEKDVVIQELSAQIEQQQKHKEVEDLEKLKVKREALAELKPSWDDKSQLERTEIPNLKQKKASLEAKIQELKSNLEDLNDSLGVLKGDETMAQSLLSDAALHDQYQKEIKRLDDEIRKLEGRRNPVAKEHTVTLTDVQTDLESLEGTMKAKNLEKESKENLRNSKITALNKAQQERNRVKEKKNNINSELQNRENVEKQKKELEDGNVGLKVSIQEIHRKLPSIRSSIGLEERKKAELIEEKERRVRKTSEEKMTLQSQKDRLNSLYKAVEEFRGDKVKYDEERKKAAEITAKYAACDANLKELATEVQIIGDEIRSQEIRKRELRDTLLIKNNEGEIAVLSQEIAAKEQSLNESKNRSITTAKREIQNKIDTLTARKNQNTGVIASTQETIRNLIKDLNGNMFNNAEEENRKAFIKKMVQEKAQRDIRLYRAALDRAVMTFHHKKMEAINRHLKAYWRKIYKGNDIDWIMIKTDNEDPSQAENVVAVDMNKSTRKVYNYRVVMSRRGVELDMRGRCSAGQKVLASIIIRLALSQTFGTQCGIITLDEPTTNLDKPNIDSLAETLSDLALSMKGNKTFQLVVITHDDDFIDRLLRVDPVEYYYRVSRNQMGHSRIERLSK